MRKKTVSSKIKSSIIDCGKNYSSTIKDRKNYVEMSLWTRDTLISYKYRYEPK